MYICMKKLCIVLLALSSFILASCGGTPASQDAVPVSTDLPAEQAVVEEVLSPEAQAAYDAEQAIAQEAEAQLAEELE